MLRDRFRVRSWCELDFSERSERLRRKGIDEKFLISLLYPNALLLSCYRRILYNTPRVNAAIIIKIYITGDMSKRSSMYIDINSE